MARRLDQLVTTLARRLARRTSRRGALAVLGGWLTGVALVPLLPVSRAGAQPAQEEDPVEGAPARAAAPGEPPVDTAEGDPSDCQYWRYCSIDGFLSSCCGGTHTSCPPGTEMSSITWLGTCRNPEDGVHYVISYNDCCGKDICGRCFCRRSEGDKPVYFTHKSNDINWCMGTTTVVYNSTVALVVGVATEPE